MIAEAIVRDIARRLWEERRWRAYIVGGFVRDRVMGLPSKDLDVEVFGPPTVTALERELRRHGFAVCAVGKAFGVLKVKVEGEDPIDFSLPRREIKVAAGHKGFDVVPDGRLSLAEAVQRRDFSMNGLFIDPLSPEHIIDIVGGIDDIKAHRLRHTGPGFAEDPLRVLRGMQFCGRFDLTAERETVALCRSLLPEFKTLPGDRVWTEWEKFFAKSIKPSCGLIFLHRTGWITEFPFIARLIGVPQNSLFHPEGSVWEHTKQTVDRAAVIAIAKGLPRFERAVLVAAALLHDIGKPDTTFIADDGSIKSHQHNIAGETLALYTLEHMYAPNVFKEWVPPLVREHMFFQVDADQISERSVRRLAHRLDSIPVHMLTDLMRADIRGCGDPFCATEIPDRVDEIASAESIADTAPVPILMGRHLIEMGMKPGKRLGAILRAVFERQLDGDITTLEDALEAVREIAS